MSNPNPAADNRNQSKQKDKKNGGKQDKRLSNFFTFVSMMAVIAFFYILSSHNHFNSGKEILDKYPVIESIGTIIVICTIWIIYTYECKAKPEGIIDKIKERFLEIWDKINLQFEMVHLIVCGLLLFALRHPDNIPEVMGCNKNVIAALKEPIQDIYDQVVGIFFLGRLFVQINEINGKNFGTKGKIFQNVLSTASGLGLIIIEACIMEILFTDETLFRTWLFGPLKEIAATITTANNTLPANVAAVNSTTV